MKLKLKVTKTLKRALKEKAIEASMERVDFIHQVIMDHINAQKYLWEKDVATYPTLLMDRQKGLEDLKETLEESDLSKEVQLARLKAYYKEHHMYRVFYSKKRKFENIIIHLDDEIYFALCLIGEANMQAVETYTVNLLEEQTKQP